MGYIIEVIESSLKAIRDIDSERNRVVVEYALRGVDTPIGVARYQLMLADALPAQLAEALPSPQELEPGMLPGAGDDDA